MSQQSAFLITTLEKIGTPLAAAVEEVSQRVNADMEAAAREVEDAKVMAQLLGQTIQIGLSLGGALIQASDEAEADALRLAVAAMVAPVIAHYYRHNGKAPDDQALSRITKSLEATIAFAENFNPASEQRSRLSMLGSDTLVFDSTQVDITVLDALVPVMNAIGEFSFGLSETKLLQDVSEKLKEKAQLLKEDKDKLSELMILKSLAKIYAECHLSEVRKLSASNDTQQGDLSIDPVWKAFDTRLAMVGTVLGLAPVSETVASGATAPSQHAAQEGSPSPDPAPAQPQAAPTAQTPPAAPSTPASSAGGNPMSFFTNKPAATQDVPPQSSTPPQQAPQQTEQQAPPASAETNASSSNPMSFFKPGAKPAEEEKTQ